MKVNELRIGNIVYDDEGSFSKVTGIKPVGEQVLIDIYHNSNGVSKGWMLGVDELSPIPLTEELLLRCGFKRIQHFTVKNSLILDIGRGRELSIGDVENCNQMMYVYKRDGDAITGIVCLHNYDYDGWLSLHQLQNLYFAITGEELEVDL